MTDPGIDYTTNVNTDVYYSDRYWNDLLLVREYINRMISGRPDIQPERHFIEKTARTFNCALMLNCGNGWVERSLFEHGAIKEAVGIDYGEGLLDTARSLAAQSGLAARYVQMDTNTSRFPDGDYDLAVNWAAGHHIAYVDRVFRELCRLLPADGWMLSFDYVGPHRNQYPAYMWEEAWRVNQTLPARFRQDLQYPHLPDRLLVDPTEAIHSELVLPTFRRYYTIEEYVPLGGAVAYPLLTFNDRLFAAEDDAERDHWIDHILAADAAFLAAHPESSLFAYFTGHPAKAALDDAPQLAKWAEEENSREMAAAASGGEYYPHTALQAAYMEIEDLHREVEQLHVRANQGEAALEAVRESATYRLVRLLGGSAPMRILRSNRHTADAIDRLRQRITARRAVRS